MSELPIGASQLAIAARLLALSEEMRNIAIVMDYYGGFTSWSKHARELAGAASIAEQWSNQITLEHESQSSH